MPPVRLSSPLTLTPPRRAPAGTRVYAVGDVHGRSDLLDRLHEAIVRDAQNRISDRAVIVYLGDYIDRGGDSAGVIARLAAPAADGPGNNIERRFLLGNHEAFMRAFLDGDLSRLQSWLWNGGMATLDSYGLTAMNDGHEERWAEGLRDDLARAVPPAHKDFLRALAPYRREGDLFFVHAGVRPGVALEDQSPEDMAWIRDEFLDSTADFGALVVHGHSVTPEPCVRANRIGIDTGAWRSGHLTAAVFEGDQVAFLAT